MKKLVSPSASSPQVSAVMRGNKSRDTLPELLLRSALWKLGIRGYRKQSNHLPGRPDIFFPSYRLAIFVHGCFWHQCPKCNISLPKTNSSYWGEKLRRNVERDKRVFKQLKKDGWKAIRIWECEIHSFIENCVNQIYNELNHDL